MINLQDIKEKKIFEKALKHLNKKASQQNIKMNQNIFNEFYEGLNELEKNIECDQEVNIIYDYVNNIISKYTDLNNKSVKLES